MSYTYSAVQGIWGKGANPQRVSTEILIEIKQFYSGRIASRVYGVPIERSFFHRKWT